MHLGKDLENLKILKLAWKPLNKAIDYYSMVTLMGRVYMRFEIESSQQYQRLTG